MCAPVPTSFPIFLHLRTCLFISRLVPKVIYFVILGLGSVYVPFNSGKAGLLCLTCFDMKIAGALLKWFPLSSNIEQPGLTGCALPKLAT